MKPFAESEWCNENNLPKTVCKDETTAKINAPLHVAEVLGC